MSDKDEELSVRLKTENEEYRRLCEKHSAFEKRLGELQEKLMLSEEEKIEEKNIKKQKLLLKDKMENIRERYRKSMASKPAL